MVYGCYVPCCYSTVVYERVVPVVPVVHTVVERSYCCGPTEVITTYY